MAWIEGMLTGFQERKADVERENLRRAELALGREAEVYRALTQSSDPKIRTLAVTGLLESARPQRRRSGLQGWLGQMERSPMLGQIEALINTPEIVEEETIVPGLPSTQRSGYIGLPPASVGSMALPADSAVTSGSQPLAQVGAPPPALQAQTLVGAPPPSPTGIDSRAIVRERPGPAVGRIDTRTVRRPREIFQTPEQAALAAARAKAQGDVEGEVAGLVAAGFSEDEARELVRQEYLRRASSGAPFQSIAGELPNGDPAFGVFDRVAGVYRDPITNDVLAGFRPRTTTGSTSLGTLAERAAGELGYRSAAAARAAGPAAMAAVNARAAQLAQQESYRRGTGSGQARVETELQMPIGPTAAAQFNVSPTTTLADLSNTIGLDTTQKQRVYSIGQIDVLIDEIDRLLPTVYPNVPEGVKGALYSAYKLGAQQLARDADLAALDASINAALAQVAQLSGQPGSRLSDRDIELARSTLASLTPTIFSGDTLKTAQARLGVIKKLLEQARTSVPTSVSPVVGTPPPGGAARTAPASGGTLSPGPEWEMINGVLHRNGKPY